MRFAIAIPTAADSWRLVRRAEELGFSRAWFYDTQMLSADPFVAMAAAAMKTTKIRLGTGVLIPSNRLAAVAANAFASLNRLAPGRIDFGIGTGFTGRRAMGLGAVKLADLEEYVRVVTALLAGETVEAEIEGKRRLIRLLNPELGLINTRDPIGLYVAASGPKARALTAKLGAGWINTTGDVASAVAALGEMRRAWAGAGQSRELEPIALTGGCILAEGEPADSPRALAQAGPRAAMLLHRAADAALMGWPAIAAFPPAVAAAIAGLCRARPPFHAAGRALPRKPPRPSDGRQARGTAFRHRRPHSPPDLHRDRVRIAGPTRRPRRCRLRRDRDPDRPRPGTRDRGLGQAPPRLRVMLVERQSAATDAKMLPFFTSHV
jgi:5,10-methylenetetrahydromethanopterin reductase